MDWKFCAKFCWKLRHFPLFQRTRCAPCYSSSLEIEFHFRENPLGEEEIFEKYWRSQWEEKKHLILRKGTLRVSDAFSSNGKASFLRNTQS